MAAAPAPADMTGLVLAGGRGSRMGGIDKGLALFHGTPLALLALRRLLPQVGEVAINANRNAATYAGFGAPVWPDRLADHPGPLAGMLIGLERCSTPYLLTVPCDVPFFPTDLAGRLASALAAADDAALAIAVTEEPGSRRPQPIFCLMKTSLALGLRRFLETGERRVGAWARLQRCAEAVFTSTDDFRNLNTDDDLARENRGA